MLFTEIIQLLLEPYGTHKYVLRQAAESCNVAAGGTFYHFTDLNVTLRDLSVNQRITKWIHFNIPIVHI
jgi:hypothetical protein